MPSSKKPEPKADQPTKLEFGMHKQILNYLNEAVRVDDLMFGKPETAHTHGEVLPADHAEHDDQGGEHGGHRDAIIDAKTAKSIMALKVERFPTGFRHVDDLRERLGAFDGVLDGLIDRFSPAVRGCWTDFPIDIPRRGLQNRDGIVHAAMLRKTDGNNGKVLFITADETTLLWNPEDTTPATFEDPVNQPDTMPDGYSQVCGHHTQLADGSLLSVGGGGYGPNPLATAGYIFDPDTRSWSRTANDMSEAKWYPTAVSLGGNRVLVVSGRNGDRGQIDVFDEVSKTFQPVTGDDHRFPNIYPGLHLLPNNAILYSRTGFGDAGAGPGAVAFDDPTDEPQSLGGKRGAYCTYDDATKSVVWQKITPGAVNRGKGMSVMLLSGTPPYVRIIVLGGTDPATNHTYEILDASVLSPTAAFDPAEEFPDGEQRSLCSGVLLPDGNLFVCGGIQRNDSPCTMFDPQSNSWSPMANLPSIRDYHSTGILLPSGQVMMAGWNNTKIEIFNPPYLFRGDRPTISAAPDTVHHGAEFTIESPDAHCISKVVFIRPMAVTHQTDTDQRIIELKCPRRGGSSTELKLTAPNGAHPHPTAPRGHYMMFILNDDGVPSVAKWIFLH